MHRHRYKPFLCSYEGCERGVIGNSFPRHRDLREHMERVHNYLGQPRSNALVSPPPSRPPIGKKHKAGEQDNP
jgi:hypothetical protein